MKTLFKLLAGVALVAVLAVSPHANAQVNTTILETTISGTINSDSMFVLNMMLKMANKDTFIAVYIDSPGGRTKPALETIRLMNETKAHVVCYVPRYAASAAAHIVSSCDLVYALPTAKIMYHQSYYRGSNGKIRDAGTSQTDMDMQIRYNLNGILKQRSMEFLDGKDVVISGHQLNQTHIESLKR